MRRRSVEWPFWSGRGGLRPSAWRQREKVRESPRRWSRWPEPWEQEAERFDGSMVLEDLARCTGDAAGTARLLARYVAARLVRRAAEGELEGLALGLERRIAGQYVARSGPAQDPERRALRELVAGAAPRPAARLAAALSDAGDAAADLGHPAGAYALYLLGYELSLRWDWPAEGARAAASIAVLALAGGGRWSVKRWRRRATVLARRAALRRAEAETDAGGIAPG